MINVERLFKGLNDAVCECGRIVCAKNIGRQMRFSEVFHLAFSLSTDLPLLSISAALYSSSLKQKYRLVALQDN